MRTFVLFVSLAAACRSPEQASKNLANTADPARGAAKAGEPPRDGAETAVADRKNLLDDVDLVATYDVHAEGDGALPDGTLTLKKIRGDAYKGTLEAGGKKYHVAAYRDGDLLSLAWSDARGSVGAAAMELFCDLSLEAHYSDDDAGSTGKALVTGGNSSFTGTWTVEKGTYPGDDGSWAGRLDAKPFGDSVVTFAVSSADNGTNKYLLIRHGDVLGGGYRYDKKPFVAAHLRIGGGGATLEGQWTASTEAAPTAKPLHAKRHGGPAPVTVALKPAGTAKTPSGIACLDVPAGGHALFPKHAASGGGGGGGGGGGNACSGSYTSCNGNCVDLLNDPNNCGVCGNSCPVRMSLCHSGSCDCFEVEKDNNGGVCP